MDCDWPRGYFQYWKTSFGRPNVFFLKKAPQSEPRTTMVASELRGPLSVTPVGHTAPSLSHPCFLCFFTSPTCPPPNQCSGVPQCDPLLATIDFFVISWHRIRQLSSPGIGAKIWGSHPLMYQMCDFRQLTLHWTEFSPLTLSPESLTIAVNTKGGCSGRKPSECCTNPTSCVS